MPDPFAKDKTARPGRSITKLPSLKITRKASEEYLSPAKPKFKPAILLTQPLNKTFDGTVIDKGKEIFYTPY